MVKVAVGSDDLYPCAKESAEYLRRRGFEVVVVGSLKSGKSEPWPDVALEVAKLVSSGEARWGLLVCYTGTGVSIVANKVRGVRAALCNDPGTARGARLWNDANVLVMSGRLVTEIMAREVIDAWLSVEAPDLSELGNIEKLKRIDAELRGPQCAPHL
ncbi:MAG: RpiB/LacA/LacB family sugar-phosphate isomerase [Candidatus Nezhaarchaeota archaeon]|nr:RpiB/LacA/LacB family sugar-phosphate isomerase [Candidatus Nezhaarchaeota archaeon]